MKRSSRIKVLMVVGRHPQKYLGGGYVAAWATSCAVQDLVDVRLLVIARHRDVAGLPEVIRVPDVPKVFYPVVFFFVGMPYLLFWATHLHAHDRAGILLGMVARLIRKPFLFSVYNGLLEPSRWGDTPFLMKIDWLSAKLADVVFTMSTSSLRQVALAYSLAKERIVVSGGGVGASFLDHEVPPRQSGVVLFVGRLDEKKGAETALRAFIQALARHPKLRMVFAGDGEMSERLKEHSESCGVAGSVTFLGYVPPNEMVGVYDTASILLLPTKGESFGLVLAEAMARCVVPVASRVGAVPEVIEHEVNGLLVDQATPEGFAREVSRLVEDPEVHERLAHRGRLDVLSRMTWRTVGQCCVEAYRRQVTVA